jgi:hypothetical protein
MLIYIVTVINDLNEINSQAMRECSPDILYSHGFRALLFLSSIVDCGVLKNYFCVPLN